MRHGRADMNPADDASRTLTPEGYALHEEVCHAVKKHVPSLDLILTSPLLRARQSAGVLSAVISASIGNSDALGPHFDHLYLLKQIPPLELNQSIAFVGHEPSLSSFVNALVGRMALSHGLDKSGAVVLRFNEKVAFGSAEFVAYIHPGNVNH